MDSTEQLKKDLLKAVDTIADKAVEIVLSDNEDLVTGRLVNLAKVAETDINASLELVLIVKALGLHTKE